MMQANWKTVALVALLLAAAIVVLVFTEEESLAYALGTGAIGLAVPTGILRRKPAE